MDKQWRIEMLGCLRATQGVTIGRSVGVRTITRFRTRKAAALLAYLAYHPHHAHRRELLIELLWPECLPEHGRNNLSRELTWLRRQLEPTIPPVGPLILADRHAVRLNPAAVTADVAAFEGGLRAATHTDGGAERMRRLTAAAALYRGELLPGAGEAWVVPERLRLAESFLSAMHELVAAREAAGDLPGALELAWRAAAVDAEREETHVDLVRLLVSTGHPEAARLQCREWQRFLEPASHGRGKPSPAIGSSPGERMAQRRLEVQAAEAEELRRQLALRTAESAALRQRLQQEMAETRRLRQELAAEGWEREALARQPAGVP